MNALLDRFFSWLVHTSWEASVVVLLVLGAQFLFKRRLPARWRYALWFLVVLRLIVPALPHSPFSLNRFPKAVATVSNEQLVKTFGSFPPSSAVVTGTERPMTIPEQNEPKFQWLSLGNRMYALLWLTGALAFAVATLVNAGRFAWALRRARPCQEEPILEIAHASALELGLRRDVRIVSTPLVSGPAMIGIFRPTLLLPEGLIASFSPAELRVVFLHEFAHLRRGDMILNALLVVLQILHWFNPVLWFAFSRMRHDRELATDALVLSETRASLKTLYGHTLLKLIEGFDSSLVSPRLVGIMENPKDIKDRLVRITQATPGAYRRSILGLTLLAVIGVTALTQGVADPTATVTTATPSSGESKGTEKTKTPRPPDDTAWYLAGTRLSADAVEALEKQVATNPDDLEARVKILGYYSRKRIFEESARAAAQPHILWIIRNLPDTAAAGGHGAQILNQLDPARYDEARKAWNEQLAKQPNNPKVFGNAATFFLLSDMPLAEKLLRQAQALEPKNPAWAERLGQLFTLKATSSGAATTSTDYHKALESYEAALPDKEAKGDQKGDLRFYQLATIAQAAFNAGDLTKARAYSEELLSTASSFKGDWNYGNAIYTGNSILGLIALSQDDVSAAKTYLLAASATPGSPQLNSFGPDLTLAKKLLERGEKETVITFLGNVAKFWKDHEDQIKQWQENIRQGQIPILGSLTRGMTEPTQPATAVTLASGESRGSETAKTPQPPNASADLGKVNGAAIFDRVKKKYSSCKTFSCTGTFAQTSNALGARQDDRTFLIRFSRPGQIRVDWTESRFMGFEKVTSSIYTEDGKIFSYSATLGGPKPYPSISQAIGVEAGVSGGISYLIPALLLGESGYLDHWTITRGQDSSIGGVDCYSVSLETKGFGIYTFDIAKADFSILRAAQASDASVLNAQRERARKENPAWFNDPPGTPKLSLSTKAVLLFQNLKFDEPIKVEEFRYTKP